MSSRWYNRQGEIVDAVPTKKGGTKRPTIKEARELNLLPSVTSILGMIAKPELERWKIKNSILASLTLPRIENESEDAFAERAADDADSISKNAMGLGSTVHAAIEQAVLGYCVDLTPYDEKTRVLVDAATTFIRKHQFNGRAEIRLANNLYAGTIDFAGMCNLAAPEMVIDFKTQGTKPDRKVTFYDDWSMQLAAYRYLLGNPKLLCANIIFSTTEPGRIEVKLWDELEIENAMLNFWCILGYFRNKNKLYPIGAAELIRASNYTLGGTSNEPCDSLKLSVE